MSQIPELILRRAQPADLRQMLQIMDEALEIPTIAEEMPERVGRWLKKIVSTSQFIFYVAEIDRQTIIGWCRGGQTIECHQRVADQIYHSEVQNIFVRPHYQRRGVGAELWRILWNEIIQQFHPENLVVWSVDKAKAQRFYLSLGGVEQEQKSFDDGCVLTAFTWNNLKPYE